MKKNIKLSLLLIALCAGFGLKAMDEGYEQQQTQQNQPERSTLEQQNQERQDRINRQELAKEALGRLRNEVTPKENHIENHPTATTEKHWARRTWESVKSFFGYGDLAEAKSGFSSRMTGFDKTAHKFDFNPNRTNQRSIENNEIVQSVRKCDTLQKEEIFNEGSQDIKKAFRKELDNATMEITKNNILTSFNEKFSQLRTEIENSGMLNSDQMLVERRPKLANGAIDVNPSHVTFKIYNMSEYNPFADTSELSGSHNEGIYDGKSKDYTTVNAILNRMADFYIKGLTVRVDKNNSLEEQQRKVTDAVLENFKDRLKDVNLSKFSTNPEDETINPDLVTVMVNKMLVKADVRVAEPIPSRVEPTFNEPSSGTIRQQDTIRDVNALQRQFENKPIVAAENRTMETEPVITALTEIPNTSFEQTQPESSRTAQPVATVRSLFDNLKSENYSKLSSVEQVATMSQALENYDSLTLDKQKFVRTQISKKGSTIFASLSPELKTKYINLVAKSVNPSDVISQTSTEYGNSAGSSSIFSGDTRTPEERAAYERLLNL
ncbi:MAG: hypothetical protein WC747_04760 [Candidatus Babeliales bacterium]